MNITKFGKEQIPHHMMLRPVLFYVFEHFDKPKETLSIVREMLKPGGWIAISVPNRDRWPNLHEESDQPPWHLTYWNKDALAQCISRNEFMIVS